MKLVFKTIQQVSAITSVIYGCFTGISKFELIISRGNYLELLTRSDKTGKLISLYSGNLFSKIILSISFGFLEEFCKYLLIVESFGKISIFKVGLSFFSQIDSIELNSLANSRNISPSLIALDKKRLIFMLCGIHVTKFILYIKKNKFSVPVFFTKCNPSEA